MQHTSPTNEAAGDLDEIVEIEASELELREDLAGSLFSCCPILPGYGAPSDRRLKVEIEDAGTLSNGLKLHSWRYLGGSRRFIGFMADELLAEPAYAHAVRRNSDGLMLVDYGAVGFIPPDFEAMRVEGCSALERYRKRLN